MRDNLREPRDEDPGPPPWPEGKGGQAGGREATRDAERTRDAAWAALRRLAVSERQSDLGRLVRHGRGEPAQAVFDMLRTRVAQAMQERGWSRIAISSPTKGCGKTFVAANLALALARLRTLRVGLMDLDFRMPSLAAVFGAHDAGALSLLLGGHDRIEDHVRRIDDHLAVAFNGVRLQEPAEALNDTTTGETLDRLQAVLGLDILIFDLPPMLACDDFLAFLPKVDCALLVAGGGVTRADEIRRCAKLIEGRKPLLGVVLNQADDPDVERYRYGYGPDRKRRRG